MSAEICAPGPDVTQSRTWSTERLPEPEQFPFWREVVNEAFVPVAVRRSAAGPFRSRVDARRVGSIGVSRITSAAQSVIRTQAEIDSLAGDVCFVNLPLSEGTFASQDGRVARLKPGDFTVIDGARPFELGFEQDFQQISLALPHDLLGPGLAAASRATATPVCGATGVGAIASSALRAFAADEAPLDRHTARLLTEELGRLIALALGAAAAPWPATTRSILLAAAHDEVARSLADHKLSPAHVAERLSISPRYLHRLFADQGVSFSRWVLEQRLQRCHRELSDLPQQHRSISTIANGAGFLDPSYFARVFKARYGVTPSQVRLEATRAETEPTGSALPA